MFDHLEVSLEPQKVRLGNFKMIDISEMFINDQKFIFFIFLIKKVASPGSSIEPSKGMAW